ncbi:hypothetical protein ACFFIX_18900 [Metabacillus herbersteinensis]|uniref:Uncharacterized protein n=1 Tax=Metabacillus herbersteinensis TaxID=283816 RepID=A0ABV6GIG1_9BACI
MKELIEEYGQGYEMFKKLLKFLLKRSFDLNLHQKMEYSSNLNTYSGFRISFYTKGKRNLMDFFQ